MPYYGGDHKGFFGENVANLMEEYATPIFQVMLIVVLLLVIWAVWSWWIIRRERLGTGGKVVAYQTMDQAYFDTPYEYTPAAQYAARKMAEEAQAAAAKSEGMDGSRDAAPGSGVTSLAHLMDQEARAKFLVDNQCARRVSY